jgi:HEAT repeat protein
VSRADDIAELLRIALYDTDGETQEGAFVDYWVSNASRALFGLRTLFEESEFAGADEEQIRAALREPGVPPEAAAGLVAELKERLRPLVRELLSDPDPAIRAVGARCAAEALPEEDWLAMLADAEGEVRAAAVTGVVRHYGSLPDANNHLIRALEDPDPRVVLAAGPAVRLSAGGAASEALARRAFEDTEGRLTKPLLLELAWKVRMEGVSYAGPTLENRVGRAAIDTLIWALTYPDTEVRAEAVLALSRFRTEEMAKLLFERLHVETEPDVRNACPASKGTFTSARPRRRSSSN